MDPRLFTEQRRNKSTNLRFVQGPSYEETKIIVQFRDLLAKIGGDIILFK